MSRYILIRRLRGPAFLLLIGVLALLHQAHWIHFWRLFWPLMLILWGSLLLAERAALAADGGYPPFPGEPYPYESPSGTGVPPYPGQPIPQYQGQPSAIIPVSHDLEKDPRGGQS
jgi:hypothetical protein